MFAYVNNRSAVILGCLFLSLIVVISTLFAVFAGLSQHQSDLIEFEEMLSTLPDFTKFQKGNRTLYL